MRGSIIDNRTVAAAASVRGVDLSFLTVAAFSTAPSELYGMSERGVNEFDLVEITSISRDGRGRTG